MAWQQNKGFNQGKAGTVKGYCLRNVRQGYGIGGRYLTATSAWNNAQQHRDRDVPHGVDVPLFYSFYTKSGNEGHINVRLANGTVWSDGKIFNSIADFESKQTPDYLGWSETLNGQRVISWTADPRPATDHSERLYFYPIGQTATFYKVKGGEFKMHIKDASYNWKVLENQGHRVRVNSASAGGDCWVYMNWQTGKDKGKLISGRSVR